MDGQSERTIQTLEDMLRACVMEFKGSWDTHLELMEFSYNNSYQASIEMAPFEALYGRKCRTPVCWDEVGERRLVGLELVQITSEKVKVVRDNLKIARDRQKSYADNRRRDLQFEIGDWVFLKIPSWKGVLRFGKRGKLRPRYIQQLMEFKGSWDTHLALMEFSYNNNYQASIEMAPFEALYGRKCRTPVCWDEVGERRLVGLELVQITSKKVKVVRDNLKIARDRQKSYADNRRRDLQFEIGDWVFLKIPSWKGVLRFGKRGKLRPRYIGPYEIISRVGPIAYILDLPSELSKVHNVFHVSMLRKYIPDPSHVLRDQPVELKDNLTYKEQPMQIVDRKEQILRNKVIPLVKVLWGNHEREAATWEPEAQMHRQYPQLFSD